MCGRISIIILTLLLLNTTVFAEDNTGEKEKVVAYWGVSTDAQFVPSIGKNDIIDTSFRDVETKANLDTDSGISNTAFPFDSRIRSYLKDLILQFDSLAASVDKESKNLKTDFIELRLAVNMEGKLVLVGGDIEAAMTIRLKKE